MTDFFQNQFHFRTLLFSAFAVLLLTIGGTSCNVVDREEQIPAYLFIDTFSLTTKTDNSQGSNAHDIVDAWVYANGQLIGTFEVPATIPILANDKRRITIFGGIKRNGRTDDRAIFPFYKAIQDSVDLKSGKIDSIHPQVVYFDSTKFRWIEDFEDRSISLAKSGINVEKDSIQLTYDPNEVYGYGAKNLVSGFVEFDKDDQKFEAATISKFLIPAGKSTYLEINYKLEANMQVGLYAFDAAGNQIGSAINVLYLFNTKNADGVAVWKKSYIHLDPDISQSQYKNASFKVFLQSYGSGAGSRIYFDNLKILHY
ncbi:MAG: hypothetical protein H6607_03515 [Flavobacteriales bacterium]|nr:hypothetical protein [Flavobacteriales bacterium]